MFDFFRTFNNFIDQGGPIVLVLFLISIYLFVLLAAKFKFLFFEISDVQKYLCNVDDTFLDINNFVVQTDICQKCNEGELIPIEHEGMLVCNKCSTTLPRAFH